MISRSLIFTAGAEPRCAKWRAPSSRRVRARMSSACAVWQDWAAAPRGRCARGPGRHARRDDGWPEPGKRLMLIIDCHGHYTTAPDAHQQFRDKQLAR